MNYYTLSAKLFIKKQCLLFLMSFLFLSFLNAYAQNLSIKPNSEWSAIYAGTENSYSIVVSGEADAHVSLTWFVEAKGRTLSKGETEFYLNDIGKHIITLPLTTPPIKPAVKVNGNLFIEVAMEKENKLLVKSQLPLTIFGPDILLGDNGYFKTLEIYLFDPIGKTIKVFQNIKIPFKKISKRDLEHLTNPGLVVVGAEVALDKHISLTHTLIELAEKRFRILILQPSSGSFSVFDFSKNIRPVKMSFADHNIVQSFSNDYKWIENDSKQQHHLILINHRQDILLQVIDNDKIGWDWFYWLFVKVSG